jgi:hypothetical protein
MMTTWEIVLGVVAQAAGLAPQVATAMPMRRKSSDREGKRIEQPRTENSF